MEAAIYDTNGAKVAGYAYDAWGNCKVTYNNSGYGSRNPIRYRGYYWDVDLNMYYLMTRYYDPATGRFINADTPEYLDPNTINGLNLYAYCGNNPVMCVDPSGEDAILLTIFDWTRGLPIFGHTVLLIEVDGNWYRTEFASGMPKYEGFFGFLIALFNMQPHIDTSENPIDKDSVLDKLNSYMMTEFKGDFRPSYEFAKAHNGTAYKGGYRLFTNNCAHYVVDALLESFDLDPNIRDYYEKNPFIPIVIHLITDFIINKQ